MILLSMVVGTSSSSVSSCRQLKGFGEELLYVGQAFLFGKASESQPCQLCLLSLLLVFDHVVKWSQGHLPDCIGACPRVEGPIWKLSFRSVPISTVQLSPSISKKTVIVKVSALGELVWVTMVPPPNRFHMEEATSMGQIDWFAKHTWMAKSNQSKESPAFPPSHSRILYSPC